jgi:hypothetical protein
MAVAVWQLFQYFLPFSLTLEVVDVLLGNFNLTLVLWLLLLGRFKDLLFSFGTL